MPASDQGVSLAEVLTHIVRDVVSTQDALDRSFVSARAAHLQSGEALAPVWFRMDNVRIAMELVTSVREGEARKEIPASSGLFCRLPNPISMALYGRDAVTSTRISVEIAPLTPRFPS